MTGLCVVAVLLFAVNVIGQTTTTYDCTQTPPFTPDVKNCCKRPTINVSKYKTQCYNSTLSSRFGVKSNDNHAFMNPCAIECIYTQAGALNNGRFNFPNLKALLLEIMPNSTELANIVYAGFQKCGPETQKKIQEFEASTTAQQPKQCSPFAVISTFCAMRQAFINCPSSLWTTSDVCTKAKNYLTYCEPMQFGGPKPGR